MSRHPFHVQDCESIWHLAEENENGHIPLSFSRASPNAFVAGHGYEFDPSRDLEAMPFDQNHGIIGNGNVRIVDTSSDPDVIQVAARKHKGTYSTWINGMLSSESDDGIHRLPSYSTYHRNVDADGKRETGALTPVTFTLFVESGDSLPEKATIKTYQLRKRNNEIIQRDVIGENEIGVTMGNSLSGKCTVMPYPCTYTQKPFVMIRDVEAQELSNSREQDRFKKSVAALAFSWVMQAVTTANLPGASSSPLESFVDLASNPDASLVSTLFNYGGPIILAAGLSARALVDMSTALGLLNILWSVTGFMKSELQNLPQGITVPTDPFMSTIGVLGQGGFDKLWGMDQRIWIPLALTWVVDLYLKSKPRPETRSVRYTASDIADSLRSICASDPKSVSALGYKDRILMKWMLEPTEERRHSMRRTFERFANWIKSVTKGGADVYPRTGPAVLDGMESQFLMTETLEIEYELVFNDTNICNPYPIRITIGGSPLSMQRGGFIAAGIVEDNDSLRDAIQHARSVAEDSQKSWVLIHRFFGLPFRTIPPDALDRIRRSTRDDAIIATMRENFLYGLQKIETRIRVDGIQRLLDECTSLVGLVGFSRPTLEVNVCRVLPQRIDYNAVSVAKPVKSEAAEFQYDTTQPDSGTTEVLISNNATPSSASQTNKFVTEAATKAHRSASTLIKNSTSLWSVGSSRPLVWQMYGSKPDANGTRVSVDIERLRVLLDGLLLKDVSDRIHLAHNPFSVGFPPDVVAVASHCATIRTRDDGAVTRMVRGDQRGATYNEDTISKIVARLVLFDILCDAHIARSIQSTYTGVVVGVDRIVKAMVQDGIKLLGHLFPSEAPEKCAVLTRNDPAYYGLPGGRVVCAVLSHLFDHSETTAAAAFSDPQTIQPTTPVSIGVICRELSSGETYTRSTPGMAFAYRSPVSVVSAVRSVVDAMKALYPRISKEVPTSALSETVTDFYNEDIREENNMQRVSRRIAGAAATARLFADGASIPYNTPAYLSFVGRMSYDPLMLRMGVNVQVDEGPGNRQQFTIGNHDEIETAYLIDVMKSRNASNSLDLDDIYRDSIRHDDIKSVAQLMDKLTIDGTRKRASYSIPFAHGEWWIQRGGVSDINFDTVELSTRMLVESATGVLKPPNTATSGTIADRSSGYDYSEWTTNVHRVEPFVVEVERSKLVAWIYMSNPHTRTAQQAAAVLVGQPSPILDLAKRAAAETLNRSGYRCILWNAERILQAVYCLIGHLKTKGNISIAVLPPRTWRSSDSETISRNRNLEKATERLESHQRLEPVVIDYFLSGIWESVLRILTRNVVPVDPVAAATAVGADAQVDGGAGVGIPTAASLNGSMSFGTVLTPGLQGGTVPELVVPPQFNRPLVVDNQNGELFNFFEGILQTEYDESEGGDATATAPSPRPQTQPPDPSQPDPSPSPLTPETDPPSAPDTPGDDPTPTTNSTGASEEGGIDPNALPESFYERISGMFSTDYSTVDDLPSFDAIWALLTLSNIGKFLTLRSVAKYAKGYIRNQYDSQQAYIARWRAVRDELSAEVDDIRRSNEAWSQNVQRAVERLEARSVSQSICSVSIAQTLLKQVIGDKVALHIDMSPPYASAASANAASAVAKRLKDGFEKCYTDGVQWVTVGECCDMSRVLSDS